MEFLAFFEEERALEVHIMQLVQRNIFGTVVFHQWSKRTQTTLEQDQAAIGQCHMVTSGASHLDEGTNASITPSGQGVDIGRDFNIFTIVQNGGDFIRDVTIQLGLWLQRHSVLHTSVVLFAVVPAILVG